MGPETSCRTLVWLGVRTGRSEAERNEWRCPPIRLFFRERNNNLIAITRLLAPRDAALCAAEWPAQPAPQAHCQHSLGAVAQHREGLQRRERTYVSETLEHICA